MHDQFQGRSSQFCEIETGRAAAEAAVRQMNVPFNWLPRRSRLFPLDVDRPALQEDEQREKIVWVRKEAYL